MSRDDRELLEHERAKLTAILNHARAGFVVVDAAGRVVWSNDEFAERFRGADHDEFLGRACHEVVCRKPRPCADCPAARALDDEGCARHELQLWLDDAYHAVHLTGIPIREAGADATLVMLQDVSELAVVRRGDAAFRASEARFRTLFDGAPTAMAAVKADGSLLQVNPRFCTMLGLTGAEVLRSDLTDLLHSDDCGEVFRHVRETLSGERADNEIQARFVRRDGTAVWGQIVALAQHDGDGRPAYSILAIQDVTDRKDAQAELERARGRHDALVATIDGIVWEADPAAQRFLSVSRRAEEILGFPVEQWLTQPRFWRNHLHPEDLDRVAREFDAAVAERRDLRLEYRMTAADGRVVWLRDTATVVADGDRTLLRGVMVDVTERRESADAFGQHREQTLHAQRLESLGRLAGGIAHDFGNLVTQIIGWSDFLLRALGGKHPLRREAQKISTAAYRAAELTNHLLAFGSQQELEPELLDINGVVLGMDLMLRRVIREDVQLMTRLDAERGTLRADPGQIQQVILNLAINASEAMPEGGRLAVETSAVTVDEAPPPRHTGVPAGRWVLVSVSDTGCGMDEHTQAHLFEPFFSTKSEGAGLGLATVYGIVRQSGGHIRVDSRAGHGTSVRVYLPFVEGEAGNSAADAEAPPPLAAGTETILLVEDDAPVRALAREILESSGYRVIEANDGRQALDVCGGATDEIALMATDVIMPNMGGRDLARRLLERNPELKVLYFSSYKDDDVTAKGLIDRGAAFLQKPFTPVTLTGKIRELLDD